MKALWLSTEYTQLKLFVSLENLKQIWPDVVIVLVAGVSVSVSVWGLARVYNIILYYIIDGMEKNKFLKHINNITYE